MSNACQLSFSHLNSSKDYLTLLNSSFNTLMIHTGGKWLFSTMTLTKDTPEEGTFIRTTFLSEEGEVYPSEQPQPQPLASPEPGELLPCDDTSPLSISDPTTLSHSRNHHSQSSGCPLINEPLQPSSSMGGPFVPSLSPIPCEPQTL
jgi:hypothetical protein